MSCLLVWCTSHLFSLPP
uniref:Uncharacterized protein n=1 Tax=Arundo donax TaxID=35708 RepID=A0A0A9B6E6_ARUDO